MSSKLMNAMELAHRAIESKYPSVPKTVDPTKDQNLIEIKQLEEITKTTLQRSDMVCFQAECARAAARAAYLEIKVRREIIEMNLGIFKEEKTDEDIWEGA